MNWQNIDTVILDLDGTLIDLYLDHSFWKYIVPEAYSRKYAISIDDSHRLLKRYYDEIEHSMDWYDIDFWENKLNLPIRDLLALQAKQTKVREDVYPFLQAIKTKGKHLILLTDSHPFSLQVKLNHCNLSPHFNALFSTHQFGFPKVEQALWNSLQSYYPFDPSRTFFMDDTEKVLDSAKQFGIAYTIGVENPDSSVPIKTFKNHISVKNYLELI
ncbi:HAD family hydrolase [Bisgaardia hudsonensis]|nr:HAD family hydrolase [Bisgaardia hudsonensis]